VRGAVTEHDTTLSFEFLAALASYGQGVIHAEVCGACGAVVPRDQQGRHRGWHELITMAESEDGEG